MLYYMPKGSHDIFDMKFKKKQYFEITNVQFDASTQTGTCKLVNDDLIYTLVWNILNYPPQAPMPGAPYIVKVIYSIIDPSKKKSMNGEFVYELYSGTLPNYSSMGIPFNCYNSFPITHTDKEIKATFDLTEEFMEVCFREI